MRKQSNGSGFAGFTTTLFDRPWEVDIISVEKCFRSRFITIANAFGHLTRLRASLTALVL